MWRFAGWGFGKQVDVAVFVRRCSNNDYEISAVHRHFAGEARWYVLKRIQVADFPSSSMTRPGLGCDAAQS